MHSIHSSHTVMEAIVGFTHAHAIPGGPPLVQRKVSPGDTGNTGSHERVPNENVERPDEDLELIVRDSPDWDECWAELHPRRTPRNSTIQPGAPA